MRLLLDAGGADIDGVDSKTNRTPLFLAAQGGHVDVVRLLLSRPRWEARLRRSVVITALFRMCRKQQDFVA